MSVQRAIGDAIALQTCGRLPAALAACRQGDIKAAGGVDINLLHFNTHIRRSKFGDLFNTFCFSWWFKFFRAPMERYRLAEISHWCRTHGLLWDDLASDREPVVERALELVPHDIMVGRFRRQMRGYHLELLKIYLPTEEQNYDPFLPYLAPFMEEAKFQLQEEEELLGYHPYDRRIGYCGTSGFGEPDVNLGLMGIGTHQVK